MHDPRAPGGPDADDFVVLSTSDVDETRRVGEALGRATIPLPPGGLVVALHGDLGAGKTAFVQGVARGVGVPASDPVVSPTFTVARDYRGRGPSPVALHHVDAYRLRGPDDLDAAGYEDMCGEGRLTCVEWGERVEDALAADRLDITLAAPDAEAPDCRRIHVRASGPRSRTVLRTFRRLLAGRAAR